MEVKGEWALQRKRKAQSKPVRRRGDGRWGRVGDLGRKQLALASETGQGLSNQPVVSKHRSANQRFFLPCDGPLLSRRSDASPRKVCCVDASKASRMRTLWTFRAIVGISAFDAPGELPAFAASRARKHPWILYRKRVGRSAHHTTREICS